jgi:ABC-type Fe3+/spermidine/putrescine transport system ATPase subunit
MREGVIAQFDTPQRIYDEPASAFVASFIGGFSLVRGQSGDGVFSIDGLDAARVRTRNTPAGEGVLVIRPEDARPVEAHIDNRLSGTVLSRAYQGRCWRLVLGLGGQRVRLDWPEPAAVGSELAFSLPPERCLVLGA